MLVGVFLLLWRRGIISRWHRQASEEGENDVENIGRRQTDQEAAARAASERIRGWNEDDQAEFDEIMRDQ